MSLKERITQDMKTAMKAREKDRLGTIRLILAAIKQKEVDERTDQDDTKVTLILDKMLKQRRESITQYEKADRPDLAAVEVSEIAIIQQYLPEPLSEADITALIEDAMQQTGASSIKDMGKVMGILKPRMQGRADMGRVSGLIKARLS